MSDDDFSLTTFFAELFAECDQHDGIHRPYTVTIFDDDDQEVTFRSGDGDEVIWDSPDGVDNLTQLRLPWIVEVEGSRPDDDVLIYKKPRIGTIMKQ